MTGILVTGHGHFPTGILSAVELVAGKPEKVAGVDFEAGQSSAQLRENMEQALNALECDEVIILADLLGGTPFNTAAVLKTERKDLTLKVIAGVNMAMMIEAVFSRAAVSADELARMLKTAGNQGVVDMEDLEEENSEDQELEDGI